MKTFKLDFIVCKVKPFFEKDLLIECFSEKYGRVKLLAKYAQGKSKRFSGKLETTYYLRGVVYKGKSFYILTDCDIISPFLAIRDSYNSLLCAFYMLDIITFSTQQIQQNKPLFNLLLNALTALDESPNAFFEIQSKFQLNVLKLEGLIADTVKEITFFDFKKVFENYSHVPIKKPRYLND